jgi:hypothetical protein
MRLLIGHPTWSDDETLARFGEALDRFRLEREDAKRAKADADLREGKR